MRVTPLSSRFTIQLWLGSGQCWDVSILTPRLFRFLTRCLPKRPKEPVPTIRPLRRSAFTGTNPSLPPHYRSAAACMWAELRSEPHPGGP